MNKIITGLAAVNIALLGLAGCADRTSPVASNTPPSGSSRVYSSQSLGGAGLANNPNVPGATGRTIVLGDNSTIGDDNLATVTQRTGKY